MLYERDYRILSEEEKRLWHKAEEVLNKGSKKNSNGIFLKNYMEYYKILPTGALHYQQLFPNNYLNTDELRNKEKLLPIVEDFKSVLNKSLSEREILNFIREKKAYFIIASILKGFHYLFGHHSAFAFKEFELPPNYVIDYVLIGKNSGGYEFIFVELENCSGQITNFDGDFGTTIRKGIKQVNDWDNWLESNYSSLRLVFDKHIGLMHELRREFHELDKSRLPMLLLRDVEKTSTRKLIN